MPETLLTTCLIEQEITTLSLLALSQLCYGIIENQVATPGQNVTEVEVQVFLSRLTENPKRTFWPTQYMEGLHGGGRHK